jgi:hypothetical protein
MLHNNYELMNWPSLPREMEIELIEYINSCSFDDNIHPHTSKFKIEDRHKIQFFFFKTPEHIEKWIRENLPIYPWHSVIIQVWRYCAEHGDRGQRHKDSLRRYSYNYLLEDHPAVTRWYSDIDGSTILDEINYPAHKWYMHNGRNFHDVDNINGSRSALTIFKPTNT